MDKNFRDLLTRFVSGNCTAEERERIHQWYEKIADSELSLDAEEKRVIGVRMLANIQKESAAHKKAQQLHMFPAVFWRVAAAVLVLAVFGLWFFGGKSFFMRIAPQQVASKTTDIVYENTTNKVSIHQLPDGSTVQLEPSSTLRFREGFSLGDREVYLIGKGFFDIVKDPSRPFYVYSGKIATRVLGTSFFVDAPAGAVKVGVKVLTGKVSVFPITSAEPFEEPTSDGARNSMANGVVLSPNQKVDYYVDGGHWVTGLVEDPVPVKSLDVKTLSFVFSNTPIRDVLEDINERFGIEVMTENEKILQCTFTGDVSRMRLYDMLDVISNAIGSTYEVKGTRILVAGKGCDSGRS